MNEYSRILSETESNNSISADISAVKAGAAKIRSRRKRARFAGIAAAAALTTSVTAAAAAYNWDIRAITSAWFGGKTKNIEEHTLEAAAENVTNSFENVTVELKGAVYDENIAAVFMEFTRTDGGVFDCMPYEPLTADGEPYPYADDITESPNHKFGSYDMYIPVVTPSGENATSARRFFSRCYIVDDGNAADEKITAAFCMDSQAISEGRSKVHIEFGNIVEEKYTFRKTDIGIMLNPYTVETVYGSWSGDIDFSGVRPSGKKSISPNSGTEMSIYYQNGSHGAREFTVTELSVSQISVNVKMHSETPEEMMFLTEFVVGEMIMKDGRSIPICPNFRSPNFIAESGNLTGLNVPTEENWNINATFMLTEAINPDDVAQIKLGSTVFDME